VTRPVRSDDPLARALREGGADVVEVPLSVITEAADAAPLRAAAAALLSYDWVAFTSANAVRFLAAAFPPGQPPALPTAGIRPLIAAVGPATAAGVLEELRWTADVVPREYTGGAVAAAMGAVRSLQGARVLWPRAEHPREELPAALASAGALVDAPVAYRTVIDEAAAQRLAGMMARGEVDVVTLTAPSAVQALASAAPSLDGILFAAIGTSTAEAARSAGLPVHIIPAEHTIPALAAAVLHRLGRMNPEVSE
jgi:uroporphyrinogen-III synthase